MTTKQAANILFVQRDGSLRFCEVYRKLHTKMICNLDLLHRMDQCIDSFGEASLLSTLDAGTWYWQIEIDEGDGDKTAFTIPLLPP